MTGIVNSNSVPDADSPARVVFNKEQLDKFSKEDLIKHFLQQDAYVEYLLDSKKKKNGEVSQPPRESEERMRAQQLEASRRENVLVMRLTTKEQEVQDYISQVEELRTGVSGYRSILLDPAVNLMFQRFKQEIQVMREKLEQSQQELNAWKFTPDSNTGKRLMAKCRQLLTENEELGKVISSGRVAKIEGELALSKTFTDELKNSQTEVDDLMSEMDEEMEGLQAAAMFLQSELKGLKTENDQLKAAMSDSATKVEMNMKLPMTGASSKCQSDPTGRGEEGRTLPPTLSTGQYSPRTEPQVKPEEMEWNGDANNPGDEEEEMPQGRQSSEAESFDSDPEPNSPDLSDGQGRNHSRSPMRKKMRPNSRTPPHHQNGSIVDRTTRLEAVSISSDGEVSSRPPSAGEEEDDDANFYRTSIDRPNGGHLVDADEGDDGQMLEERGVESPTVAVVEAKSILSPDRNSLDFMNGVDSASDEGELVGD